MKYILWCDTHYHGGHTLPKTEMGRTFQEAYLKNAIFLGDIIDLGGCRKHHTPYAKSDITYLKAILGERYLTGNHELVWSDLPEYYISEGIYFTHGNRQCNSLYDMNQVEGTNFFTHLVLAPFYEWCRGFINPVTEATIDRAVETALENKCHTIIMGHTHTRKVRHYKRKGIQVIFLPRGRTEIDVNGTIITLVK